MSVLAISQEIRSQLLATASRKIMVMCWGANNFSTAARGMYLPDSLGGLTFKVQGAKFKGYVAVLLMPSDTYTVRLMDKNGRVVDTLDDVYCDNLTEVIYRRVES